MQFAGFDAFSVFCFETYEVSSGLILPNTFIKSD
jgi:hypothetical protein